jgi:linoleate 10R-lipoxygenase
VHFASNVFSLPLKTNDNPRGVYSEHEMFVLMAVIFTCIFSDLDPTKSFPLRQVSHTLAQQLGQLVEADVKSVSSPGFLSSLIGGRRNRGALEEDGVQMIRKLLDSGLEASQVTYSQILPTAIAMVPSQSQLVSLPSSPIANLMLIMTNVKFTQIIDYYLSDEGKVHLPNINRIAEENTKESDEKLLHYCIEGIRLNGTFGVRRESQIPMTVDDGGRQVNIKTGDKVFVGFVSFPFHFYNIFALH